MNCRGSLTSAAAAALLLLAVVLLSISLTGCGREAPQTPQVIYLQDAPGDTGSDGTTADVMIPTGAHFFSVYLPGDGTVVDLEANPYQLAGPHTVVIARIDYSIANRATTAIQFWSNGCAFQSSCGNHPSVLVTQYRLPASAPAAGTFTLTYPAEPNSVGFGLAFYIYPITDSYPYMDYIGNFKLAGGVAADYATLSGYAY